MLSTSINRFLARFPGPYDYTSGSDGVDATFDVICLGPERQLVSIYYWDERLPAELVARVVSAALNESLQPRTNDELRHQQLSKRELTAFRGMYPGPYRTAHSHCEYRGRCHEVICDTSGESVIHAFDRSFRGQAQLVTSVIAVALNWTRPPIAPNGVHCPKHRGRCADGPGDAR
jgi:hypothetical protein